MTISETDYKLLSKLAEEKQLHFHEYNHLDALKGLNIDIMKNHRLYCEKYKKRLCWVSSYDDIFVMYQEYVVWIGNKNSLLNFVKNFTQPF